MASRREPFKWKNARTLSFFSRFTLFVAVSATLFHTHMSAFIYGLTINGENHWKMIHLIGIQWKCVCVCVKISFGVWCFFLLRVCVRIYSHEI